MNESNEELKSVTDWCLSVKNKDAILSCSMHGRITNKVLTFAFDLQAPERKDAIEAIKHELWYAFKKCYLEKG